MSTTAKRIAVPAAGFVLLVYAIFVFNQTTQIVQSARGLNVAFGHFVLIALLLLYCFLLGTPAYLWLRLPRHLLPPENIESPEYRAFIANLQKRLSRNSGLRGLRIDSPEQVEAALKQLDESAHDVVASAASTVFLSTAISQSGRLDALVVLLAQSRLVWEVAHIYRHRPSMREFVQLYANVASTAFIAGELDDIDLEIVLGTAVGSSLAAIPGMQIMVSSILSGAANAFLTLRVGMIAKGYCRCLVRIEKKTLRRAATMEAAKLLGSIVRDGVARITRATIVSPAKRAGGTILRPFRRKKAGES